MELPQGYTVTINYLSFMYLTYTQEYHRIEVGRNLAVYLLS